MPRCVRNPAADVRRGPSDTARSESAVRRHTTWIVLRRDLNAVDCSADLQLDAGNLTPLAILLSPYHAVHRVRGSQNLLVSGIQHRCGTVLCELDADVVSRGLDIVEHHDKIVGDQGATEPPGNVV